MINTERCRAPGECWCERCAGISYPSQSSVIPKSDIPPLPAGWHGPWEAQTLNGRTWDLIGDDTYVITDIHKDEAKFLADLLNITHPSQTKEGE